MKLAAGAIAFGITGRTPPAAYQGMISLFAQTGGWSNDALATLIGIVQPPRKVSAASGVLGDLDKSAIEKINIELREHGYVLFPAQLDGAIVDRLVDFALKEPCAPRAKDTDGATATKAADLYPRFAPDAVVYDFSPESLINNPDVQRLIVDPSLAAVAEAYIGASPILDEVNMWWTTSRATDADAAAAQLYHFDMDRIRWLKVFIYLTDVDQTNGPHNFVAGSHRSGAIPDVLLKKGYARLTDNEVHKAVGTDKLRSFTGPKGTILLEDTRGLHKGSPARAGDRLMLELEFSSSMFGATPVMGGKIRKYHSDAAMQWIASRPRMYQRWTA
jgi:hypothetical protein